MGSAPSENEFAGTGEDRRQIGAESGVVGRIPQFLLHYQPLLEILGDERDWRISEAAGAVAERVGLDAEAKGGHRGIGSLVV